MSQALYPPSPVNLPKNLTGLTPSYQSRAFLAVLSIFLFFLLYFALVAALGYLVYLAIYYPMPTINKWTILLKGGAIAGAVMLFIFTLKFLFKLKNFKPENRIKLNKKEHPELILFVNQICKETGAPKPKSVYMDPDVNAYVSYTNTWLSLFLPVRKDLTIGMGLVSCLNISEFKAVIAHEFGHFAQKSMKIGSYINSANTIIHDMIYTRDKWDETLEKWRGSDIRVSFAAWAITPIIWLIRQLLKLFYIFLNIMHSSLSREMEFNADKVAVRAAGSDAIISALWKLDDGATIWNQTVNHTYLASQKNYFVKNLYKHNNLAIERNNPLQIHKIKTLQNDSRGGKLYFTNSANSKVNMYASHPPNDLREDSAKNPYIRCEIDNRSPWLLFSKASELQELMSKLIYEQYLKIDPAEYVKDDEFENFVKAESLGKELLIAYDNTFENRFLHIPTDEELKDYKESKEPFIERIRNLKKELIETSKPLKEILRLLSLAQQIQQGTTIEKSFSYKDISYTKNTLQEGYAILVADRESFLLNDFKSWDISFCSLFLDIAKKLKREKELKKVYAQHEGLNNMYKAVVATQNFIHTSLNDLQSGEEEVNLSVLGQVGRNIKDQVESLNEGLNKLEELDFVPLPNINTIKELKEAIIEGGKFKREIGNIFENDGINNIMDLVSQTQMHCQRLDQKSIGKILWLHNEMEEKLEG